MSRGHFLAGVAIPYTTDTLGNYCMKLVILLMLIDLDDNTEQPSIEAMLRQRSPGPIDDY